MVLLGLGLMISGIYQGESIGAWLVALLCIFFGGGLFAEAVDRATSSSFIANRVQKMKEK